MVIVCVCSFSVFYYPSCLSRATCLLNSLIWSSNLLCSPLETPFWEKASSFCSSITRLLYILSSRSNSSSSLRFFIYYSNCMLILFNFVFYPYIISRLSFFYYCTRLIFGYCNFFMISSSSFIFFYLAINYSFKLPLFYLEMLSNLLWREFFSFSSLSTSSLNLPTNSLSTIADTFIFPSPSNSFKNYFIFANSLR